MRFKKQYVEAFKNTKRTQRGGDYSTRLWSRSVLMGLLLILKGKRRKGSVQKLQLFPILLNISTKWPSAVSLWIWSPVSSVLSRCCFSFLPNLHRMQTSLKECLKLVMGWRRVTNGKLHWNKTEMWNGSAPQIHGHMPVCLWAALPHKAQFCS